MLETTSSPITGHGLMGRGHDKGGGLEITIICVHEININHERMRSLYRFSTRTTLKKYQGKLSVKIMK